MNCNQFSKHDNSDKIKTSQTPKKDAKKLKIEQEREENNPVFYPIYNSQHVLV